jgi:hypothetical protein
MDDPGLEPGIGEGLFDGLVVGAGLLDGDDQVAEVPRPDRLLHRGDGLLEAEPRVVHGCGWDEDAAVEIGEHPLGAGLGTIDCDDAEVLRGGVLNPGMERAGGLGDQLGARGAAASPAAGHGSHANTSWGWGTRRPKPAE